ncbi:BNR domain-containing protein [Pseudomonas sp. MAP12]|uniref:BNR domain-containing protein n=1 Tax=Geopseudomonas aromaticivorans TaxID=2849492 RepID=A0ABS6N266_9GAMM|nr:YCF48-related protein [Pseudomonas aromaticivorans]MBV2135123.1 BNR domain-containing protein [Pseudomonas aromaticivorans]
MSWKLKTLRTCVLGSVLCGVSVGALALVPAGEVGDALSRPALQASQAEKAVLLGAAVTGSGRIVAVGERGLVILSDDGGVHWRQAATPVSVTLTAVRFAGGQQGVAVGHGGVILTSSDGGESWTKRLDGQRAAQLALEDAKASGNAQLQESVELMLADGPDKPFLDVALNDSGAMLVVGAYGLAFASADAGQTWTPWLSRLDNPEGLHLYAVRQRGQTIVMAGERGLLLRSTDGGAHFSRLETPYEGSLFTAELLAESDIVVAGLKGSLLRSRDGGLSWQRVDTGVPASFTASTLAADGTLYLVNQAGQVMAWGRDALQQVSSQALPALNGILPINNEQVVLLSDRGVSTLRLAGQAQGSQQ